MPLFTERPDRPRIAAFVDYEFPVANDEAIYARFDSWAEQLGAEWRLVHTVVADPAATPRELRRRFGTGLFVPQDPHVHLNDVEHVRATLTERFDALLATLMPAANTSLAMIMVQREMQEALSMTRWLRAWQPDVIVSLGLGQGAMQAMAAAHLLDIPRVAALDTLAEPTVFGRLLPLHAQQAALLLAGDEATRDQLASSFPAARPKIVDADDQSLLARVGELLQRERGTTQPQLGPRAAFRRRAPQPPPLPTQPFLLLGTERTGSNMLVDMLTARPGVACAGELFNPRRIREGRLDWLRDIDDDHDELKRIRRRSPGELLQRLAASAHRANATHAGCKLLYYHGLIDDRVTDALAARPELRVVHLVRRHRLRQSLSMARAKGSDEWFARHGTERPKGEPHELDMRQIATDFVLHELFEDRYRALFADHELLELDYDDLANRLPEATSRIAELLGHDLGTLTPRTVKTGSRDLSQAIANFDAVRDALADTPWAELTEPGTDDG